MEVIIEEKKFLTNIIAKKEYLMTEFSKNSKLLSKEEKEILERLISLEDSVFWYDELSHKIGKYPIFREIAKFNICNRVIKMLNDWDIPNAKARFHIVFFTNHFIVYYEDETISKPIEVFCVILTNKEKIKISIFLDIEIQKIFEDENELNNTQMTSELVIRMFTQKVLRDWKFDIQRCIISTIKLKEYSWCSIYKVGKLTIN